MGQRGRRRQGCIPNKGRSTKGATMNLIAAIIGLLAATAAEPSLDPVGDAIILRDGRTVRGILLPTSRLGDQNLIVRRAWAEATLADRVERWRTAEAPRVRRAVDLRRRRLETWKRDRAAGLALARGDRIGTWIDAELTELARPDGPPPSLLMLAKVERGEVRSIVRADRASSRLLRLAWTSGIADAETTPREELIQALEGRGIAIRADREPSLDAMLPIESEPEPRWLARRAATEVAHDSGLRFIRHDRLVLPEPAPGEAPDPSAVGAAALGVLGELLGEAPPPDGLQARLRAVEARGRVGAVVTRMEIGPNFDVASAESALWIRQGAGRWSPATVRSASVRPADLRDGDANGLAADPQVAAAFRAFEGLGLGVVPDDAKRQSLRVGEAARRALGEARAAIQADLDGLGLDLGTTRRAEPG